MLCKYSCTELMTSTETFMFVNFWICMELSFYNDSQKLQSLTEEEFGSWKSEDTRTDIHTHTGMAPSPHPTNIRTPPSTIHKIMFFIQEKNNITQKHVSQIVIRLKRKSQPLHPPHFIYAYIHFRRFSNSSASIKTFPIKLLAHKSTNRTTFQHTNVQTYYKLTVHQQKR